MLSLKDIRETYENRPVGTTDPFKRYSLLIPIVEKDGELHLLFEERSKDLNVQPSEICFPGGRVEEGESYKEAALRETFEEIGIMAKDIEIIGQADTVVTAYKYKLYNFVGLINGDYEEKLNLNKDEVDHVFLVPIKWFLENPPEVHLINVLQVPDDDFPYAKVNAPNGYKFRRGKEPIPIYQYEDRIIWGLTARIVKNFIDTIS